ncbi:ribosome biogenesis GTPase YlqF [Salisediminibacterium selenitireducens]|uniref:Ribosome biogenesis GTPase A n=1 Tax=Bacillus selenitireducens (strain ATCC 700615 / DSM 15326 / MLS10) TaxID=439292 RepID=D6XTU8_BACIE|nr:ribosome biogenesis GTPase YlqF [Salisediminibacterium selenitireducens]ADH99234.1 ribosome biogenesis GTP-binding protein YlqF [[Bacillus] selenitireducens MLS10]
MVIQWYPGHMAKARRQVQEKIKQIDVVIEVCDARAPLASRNPLVDEMTRSKPRLMLLNKSDLADPEMNRKWADYFEKQGDAVLIVDAQKGKGIKDIPGKVNELAKPLYEKWARKKVNPRPIRALIIGIPNAGKSTVINRLAGKRITKIGDKPGVTKAQQWIKVDRQLDLLDTPGILWPKFEDPHVGQMLALTGAIKEEIFDYEESAVYLLRFLSQSYPELLKSRYQIEEVPEEVGDLFDLIGKRRGILISGGRIDYERVSELVFRDFRSGHFGRITLEFPETSRT